MKKQSQAKKSSGNMLIFCMLGFLILVLVGFAGLSFGTLFFMHGQLQKFNDQIALTGACRLNDSDRLGQMNNLVARCRQLVYASRESVSLVTSGATSSANQDLTMLAQQLLDESRQNAQALEVERQRLQSLSIKEATAAMNALFESQSEHYCLSFPWLKTSSPLLVSVQFGDVQASNSNVMAITGMATLTNYDQSKKIIDKTTGLYLGNIDALLPGLDQDLHFKLSPLAAPANNLISPARLIQDNMLQIGENTQLCAALKTRITAEININSLAFPGTVLSVSSTAATNGASPPIQ